MILSEIDLILNTLTEIQQLSMKQNYNFGSTIGKKVINVLPYLNKEKEKLQNKNLKVNAPQFLNLKISIDNKFPDKSEQIIVDKLNEALQDLVKEDFEIIDYGLDFSDINYYRAYIKFK